MGGQRKDQSDEIEPAREWCANQCAHIPIHMPLGGKAWSDLHCETGNLFTA